ncbi:MAG: glycosyltransferase family 9 protein [Proteobacteria bacterium]|nr:glycosyltransferase family 9 protein [Pseudomonadota bacterium]
MKKTFGKKDNILLVNITRLGDMLQATPTIAGMKLENPECKISVLVEKQFEEVCYSLPNIDEVIAIDLGMTVRSLAREQEGIIDAYEYVTEFVDELRAKKFDYCLNMSSSAYTALLLKLVGIERNGGWVSDDEGYRIISSEWARLFAASVFHQNRQFNALNLVDVFRCSAEVDDHPRHLLFSLKTESIEYARELISGASFTNTGPLIAVQAGASQGKRQWAPERFIQMINALTQQYGARVVMVGTKKELPIIEAIRAGCDQRNVFVAAGRTNIPQLAALLKQSAVLVTGDTGPMHVAVSVGTPVVSMFLASAYGFETGPYSEGNLVLQPVIGCGPCNPNKPCLGLECHDLIDPLGIAELTIRRVKEDFKTLPAELERYFDPSKVILYRSAFDERGFCDLQALNSTRFDTLKRYRDAYRHLWLDELGGFESPLLTASAPRSALAVADEALSGLRRVIECAEKGEQHIHTLLTLIQDRFAPPQALGDVNAKLNQIDREIEELGFDQPVLGPVTRMFIFGKENLLGTDPAQLASQMGRTYRDLKRRCVKFGSLVHAIN